MGFNINHTLNKASCLLNTIKNKYVLSVIVAFLSHPIASWAQQNQQDTSTANLNKAQKSVFVELKRAAGDDKNTIQSIIMIALVLAVVAVAMYLAFKGDGSEEKQGSFSRTPKKQI